MARARAEEVACGRRGLRALARGRPGSLGRRERLGRLGLGSGKREGGSDGPDWVGFWFRVGLGFGFGSGLGFLFILFLFTLSFQI